MVGAGFCLFVFSAMRFLLMDRVLRDDLGNMGARVISVGKEIGNRVGQRSGVAECRTVVEIPPEESRECRKQPEGSS